VTRPRKTPRLPDNLALGWSGECPDHGKRIWPSRRAAKRGIRAFPDPQGMREYRCDTGHGWHIGHLPPAALAGQKTAREIYTPRRTR
jgi:hypothetical protein